jgi:hypothetical protein
MDLPFQRVLKPFGPETTMSRRFRFHSCVGALWLAILGALASPRADACAEGDTLYGALIVATNAEHPSEAPPEIRDQAENLRAVFGYNQFRLLGHDRKAVPTGTEDWLVTSPKFFLRVDTKTPLPGGYTLGLQLLQEKRVLANAEVKLKRNSPLFIRGPLVGEGQLIILLMVL